MRNISVLAVFLGLTACQENLVRTDFVSSHAGDAVARNASNQTIEPWNKNVSNDRIETSSKRQADVRDKYRNKHAPEKPALNSPLILAPTSMAPAEPQAEGT